MSLLSNQIKDILLASCCHVIFTYTGARQTQEKAKISFKIHNE